MIPPTRLVLLTQQSQRRHTGEQQRELPTVPSHSEGSDLVALAEYDTAAASSRRTKQSRHASHIGPWTACFFLTYQLRRDTLKPQEKSFRESDVA